MDGQDPGILERGSLKRRKYAISLGECCKVTFPKVNVLMESGVGGKGSAGGEIRDLLF